MLISQLAERTGIRATTLRFYESAGLLSAERTRSGYRIFGEDAVERLAFIGGAKQLGLSLEEIAELARIWESGPCKDVKAALRPRLHARSSDAERRTAELARFTVFLRHALEHFDGLPDRGGRCDRGCAFLAPSGDPRQAVETERWRVASVACSLSGEEVGERAGQWRRLLSGAEREEIDEGVRLAVPVERAGDIAALAAAEQQCCPFFDFRLRLDGPVLRLEVRAPVEGAPLLATLFTPTA